MNNMLEQLNAELSTVVERASRALVQITNGHQGAGAGTIWHPDGLIVTNAHVVRRRHPQVILPDGRKLPARVLAYDPERDIAALEIDAHDLPTIELGDSRTLRPGEWVTAIGHPWGVTGAITSGAVIGVGAAPEAVPSTRELVQVGLHMRPGHSGGPLVDVRGQLVGINTMIAGPDVGFAVPVHEVKAFLRENLGSEARERRAQAEAQGGVYI